MANAKLPHHKLPVLAQVRVASPCQASWSAMTGDDRSRFCGECQTQVFDLSQMTREQAERLVIERNGDLCARYYQRADGTILTADCAVGARKRDRHRAVMAAGLAAALIGGGTVAGLQLAAGPTPEAPPDLALDNGDAEIDLTEVEAQPEPGPLDDVEAITDQLEAEHVRAVMGKISVVDREEQEQRIHELERERQEIRLKLKKLRHDPE